MSKPLILSALLTAMIAQPALARPALRDVAEVRDGIVAVGIAYEISEKCATIRPRILRGIGYLNGLKSRALELGYSEEEIDAFVNDAGEKARLEAMARARLVELGARAGDPESYCALGRAEIARDSAVGRLLR